VVGSAGSSAKVAWLLQEAGIDAAINYKEADDLAAEVGKQCPQGIDVFFENVGGKHFEAAIERLNPFGRIVVCGMISRYNATGPEPGPSNLFLISRKRLKIQGFIVGDHQEQKAQFLKDMSGWIAEGKIKWRETIVPGIENAPQALISLFTGENIGKMLVKIGPDRAV